LISFLIYNLVKLLPVFIVFRNDIIPQSHYIFKIDLLKPLLPFFLLSLGGMLVNKSDFMIVATFLSDHSKAHYQIISTFSTIGIIGAHAVLQPFIKQIYRVNSTLMNKIALNYFIYGLFLSLLYVGLVYLVTTYFFKFQLSLYALLLLYFIELIFFAINPLVFTAFRNEKQKYFVVIMLVSGVFSLLFSLLLVKPYGIHGALFANFLGNCVLYFLLLFSKRNMDSPR
jgi:O-antigen/teichoic acid export membrane protein